MSGKKRRPFELQHFTITQEKVSLPVTTDACIFGAITEFQNPKNILDVGCGSGILMFLMHQKYPNAHILGLEKHPESVQTVQENIRLNNTATAISVQEVDWWDFNPENPVDAIICNPPFFSNHLPSQELSKRNARHTDNYELWQLLVHMSHWLAHEGVLSMLVPYETLGQLEHLNLEKTTHLLFFKQAQTIQAFHDSKPHLAVVHFQKKSCDYRTIDPLIVYDKPNQFTEKSKQVLQAFLQERALK